MNKNYYNWELAIIAHHIEIMAEYMEVEAIKLLTDISPRLTLGDTEWIQEYWEDPRRLT